MPHKVETDTVLFTYRENVSQIIIIFVVNSTLKMVAVCFSEMSIPDPHLYGVVTQGRSMNLSATKSQSFIFLK
jgi:hypothetical protein